MFGWAGQGAAFAAVGLTRTPLLVAVAAAVAGFVTVAGIRAVTQSLLHHTVGPARRAALSGQTVVVTVTSSFGMLVGGTVIETLGVRSTLLGTGLVTTLVAVAAGTLGVGSNDARPRRPRRHGTPGTAGPTPQGRATRAPAKDAA